MSVIAHIEATLERARAEAAQAVDRAEAAVELRGLAYELAARREVSELMPDGLWEAVDSEQERARLQSLVDRVVPEQQEENHART